MTFTFPKSLKTVVSRLPIWPPSFLFARMLNIGLDDAVRNGRFAPLYGKNISIHVLDTGLHLAFTLGPKGFREASGSIPDLVFSASTEDFYFLASRREDPDALFFSRRLLVEGDTELGLVAKNTLDALDLPQFEISPTHILKRLSQRFAPSI
ncbi:DNA polymerase V subunit UmuC [Novimethylophilus kurashikiensis]|uniref:Ubiquinone biosynthesis accessory factor UbiT n=1 Tax=Novimethylophilus kurashikiensis TaxID=1825523 RepID=A0A2R5FEH1_9PROT|nr:SCP2 sterol-binding domain-containing protein [Novimethylophilus kurashikiensis]GBG14921.1 DNA polymerase V subunit UmuC [Novimethylophilus kurashikiensis]